MATTISKDNKLNHFNFMIDYFNGPFGIGDGIDVNFLFGMRKVSLGKDTQFLHHKRGRYMSTYLNN